jgi:hypothetical protein
MDNIIRKRVCDSKNVPDNWVKRRGKPRDPIQHSDPDFNNGNHDPTNSIMMMRPRVKHMSSLRLTVSDLDLYSNAEVLFPKMDST